NKPNKFLTKLVNKSDKEGHRHMDNKHINECFKRFYKNLYCSEVKTDTLEHVWLDNLNIPQLSLEQANLLEGPVTTLEIKKAISSLQTGECPGADGYPVEFLKTLKGKINKDPEQCSSYRPIILLSVDVKILSKILATRLEKVVSNIVNIDQTGFIKERLSSNNTRRLINIIQHLNPKSFSICLDKWPPVCTIWVGKGDSTGKSSLSTAILPGYRALAIAIRQSEDIKGILIGTKVYKRLLYADDIILTLTDPVKSIPALIDSVNKFSKISGYNWSITKNKKLCFWVSVTGESQHSSNHFDGLLQG
uniref:Uncharacterized protein n=1 Tax=Poecilia reticulata TaxID=8081 RepID=A0A3P9QCK4_POERE